MWLLYVIGAVFAVQMLVELVKVIKRLPVELAERERVNQLAADTAAQDAKLTQERARFEELKAEAANAMETISQEKALGFPWLANAYSAYRELYELRLAHHLEWKEIPAVRAAEHIRAMAAEKAALRRENWILRETFRYYESLFPWLIDFKGEELDELIRQTQECGTTNEAEKPQVEDPAAQWLTEAERGSDQLTSAEKYQRALDRYWQSKKTPWQIGRDYERYIGYLYEREGFTVKYYGVEYGLEDLGRDLICCKGGDVRVVQCKYWNKEKTLREKHVCQIFGTAIAYEKKEISGQKSLFGGDEVTAWIYTSCGVSATAREFARILDVSLVDEFPMRKYPIVKCNVSMRNGERIYHLPFDQQYDRTLIEYKDECYVETVSEAEALGFRRAYRWRGRHQG